jgi:hypothetical protein
MMENTNRWYCKKEGRGRGKGGREGGREGGRTYLGKVIALHCLLVPGVTMAMRNDENLLNQVLPSLPFLFPFLVLKGRYEGGRQARGECRGEATGPKGGMGGREELGREEDGEEEDEDEEEEEEERRRDGSRHLFLG